MAHITRTGDCSGCGVHVRSLDGEDWDYCECTHHSLALEAGRVVPGEWDTLAGRHDVFFDSWGYAHLTCDASHPDAVAFGPCGASRPLDAEEFAELLDAMGGGLR